MSFQSYEAIYQNGQVKWLDGPPDVKTARVIVTILEQKDDSLNSIKHKPSERIAGKGKILGDIISPVAPIEDWDCSK